MQRDNSTSRFILTTIRTFPQEVSTPSTTGDSSSPPNESNKQEPAADNTTATTPAKPDDKATDAFYRQYDPATGIRTAAMLGGLILLVVVYLLWKSRCRCDVEHESIDFEYWISKLDQRKAQWVRSKSASYELPRIRVDPLLCASDWVHVHHNHGHFSTQKPARFGNHLGVIEQEDPRDVQANHSLRPMRGPTFRTGKKRKYRKRSRPSAGDQAIQESDPINDVTVVNEKIYLCYFSDEEYENSMLDSPFVIRRSQSDQDIRSHCRGSVTKRTLSRTSGSESDHDCFSTAQTTVEVHICPPDDDQHDQASSSAL